jgi:hypothetical protein
MGYFVLSHAQMFTMLHQKRNILEHRPVFVLTLLLMLDLGIIPSYSHLSYEILVYYPFQSIPVLRLLSYAQASNCVTL